MKPEPLSPEQITVVVCTRNRPDLLARCLARLGELAPAPLEILVVDQSDGPETGELVRQHQRRIPNLRWIPTPSRGLSRARNLAVRESRGEILGFIDDDCLARRDWADSVARAFSSDPELAAVTGGSLPEPSDCADPRILAATTWHPSEVKIYTRPVDPSTVGGGFNLSVRRSWLNRIGPFDPELGAGGRYRSAEDTDLIHRLLLRGGRIRYDPEVIVAHLPWRDGETQSAVEWEYGYGIAVWALKRIARGDFFPSRVALAVLLAQGKTALLGALRRDASAWRTGRAYLSGLGQGVASWLIFSGFTRTREDAQEEAKTGA
ncbi:MAG: glycosyltransferase [Acidobacteria bacterium]|nr:glycosyltransferase [Acidobacteriota bacterium]